MTLVQNASALSLVPKNNLFLLKLKLFTRPILSLTFGPAPCNDVSLPLHAIVQNENQFEDVNCSELLERI